MNFVISEQFKPLHKENSDFKGILVKYEIKLTEIHLFINLIFLNVSSSRKCNKVSSITCMSTTLTKYNRKTITIVKQRAITHVCLTTLKMITQSR